MAEGTKIEWADHTFNPWVGCTKVSPGCDHCYAEARMDTRLNVVSWGAGQPRKRTKTWGDPVKWNKQPFFECLSCRWRGPDAATITVDNPPGFHPPVTWARGCPACRKPTLKEARARVFCASLADVFDNEVPPQWRGELWTLVKATPNLDWLILTKRIGNARGMAPADGFPPNVWLGATIVNQEEADRDIPKLLATPAALRFLSMEPLLGPVTLNPWLLSEHGRRQIGAGAGIGWVIVGGESGHHARPMHPDWARSLRDQCAAAGVPFFMKQMAKKAEIPADLRVRELPTLEGTRS